MGTSAEIILAQNRCSQEPVNLSTAFVQEWTTSEWFLFLMNRWFSNRTSTEEVMQESVNEVHVTEYLSKTPLIFDIFEVGMVTLKKHFHLWCSPDSVTIIKADGGRNELQH